MRGKRGNDVGMMPRWSGPVDAMLTRHFPSSGSVFDTRRAVTRHRLALRQAVDRHTPASQTRSDARTMLVLPISTAPAARQRATSVAS